MSDISSDLADLQRQLEQVEQQRAAARQNIAESQETQADDELPDWLLAMIDEDGVLDRDAVLATIRNVGSQWLEGFNDDLSNARPSSLLAIFALGVLVGKLS